MSLLRRAGLRFYLRHPWQLVLTLIGICLGVAIVTGIDLSLDSADRAFRLSLEAVAGKTSHHIVAGAGLVDESLYAELRTSHGQRSIAPLVEGYVDSQGHTLHLLGIDPLAEDGGERRFDPAMGKAYTQLMREADTALISKRSAALLGVRPGDSLPLTLGTRAQAVKIVGFLEGEDSPDAALEGLLATDIATAQEVLGRIGKLDRIEVRLADDPEGVARLQALLPASVRLQGAEGRNTATLRMTEAFTLNLKSLSFLALVVGMFIIYNSMSFNMLQRRPLLAVLRTLGVTRRQLLAGILGEAVLLGVIGALLGLGLGLLAARGLLHLVTRTISDVYFVSTVSELLIEPGVLAWDFFLGVAAAVLASLLPAVEAAFTPPTLAQRRSVLEGRFRGLAPGLALLGLVLLIVGYVLLGQVTESLRGALVGQFCQMLGFGLMIPAALAVLVSGLSHLPLGTLPRLALKSLRGSLSRTGVAIAALTLSVAATIGVGVMVHSFRGAVSEWLEQILQADVYVSLPSTAGRSSEVLPPALVAQLSRLAGVERHSTGRRVWMETDLGRSEFLVLAPAHPDRPAVRFKGGDGRAAWRDFQTGDVVMVSEPYAQRHHLAVGDTLTVAGATGPRAIPVGGVFFDYRSDQGIVLMHRRLYDRLWQDPQVSSMGLYLAPGADLEALKTQVQQLGARTGQGLMIRSNREIREASLNVFDRTFLITRVLRAMAIGVAFVGILSALLALQIERIKEYAVLRATGLTPRQTIAMVLLQTGFLGACAGLLSWPLGTGLAVALVEVINLRSFGWTMDLMLPPQAYLEAFALGLSAALLAGVYPAWRASRIAPALALRED